jgi:arginyl-tRNA synthetase
VAESKIRPMPPKHGFGVTTNQPLPEELAKGYRHEAHQWVHNYHFTPENYRWPEIYPVNPGLGMMIDGFSPNLNKSLHVGHLRNLAVAHAYSRVLPYSQPVALLGATLGVKSFALRGFENWCNFVGYKPKLYYDALLPNDIVPCRRQTAEEAPETPEDERAWVYDAKYNGPVIVKRADERPLYAYYDLAFRLWVHEAGVELFYITGNEQKEHFYNLDLGGYHLPMGLVLGEDGKKMKSRDGTAFSADDAVRMVEDGFDPPIESPTDRRKLAWNVLAWNFLSTGRASEVKFEAKKWTRVDSPGMYITYTETRVQSACYGMDPMKDAPLDLTEDDVKLLGASSYMSYWWNHAVLSKDVAGLANYCHDLARMMSAAYERERIQGGRRGFKYAISTALTTLQNAMWKLGMFRLERI